MSVGVEHAVTEKARAAGMELDLAQRDLLAGLADFVDRVGAGTSPVDDPVGWYVHGPAGRGKTWILQSVFDAVPVSRKRRVHFHTFFLELQRKFAAHPSTRAAIEATVEELLDDAEWFLFDELHVHDPAGASLLNRLLAGIVERGTPTLVTSNYAPDHLLPNPVYHDVFAPGIAVLTSRFHVHAVDGGLDYRRRGGHRREGFAAGRWIVAGDDDALRRAGLVPPAPDEAARLASGPYSFDVRAVRGSEVWFDFADLLEAATTAQDYLGWLADYDRWVVRGVPPLSETSPQARQRLVWLVDVLADADRSLTLISSVERDRFVDVASVPPDLFRTSSRLALLSPG